MHLAVFEFIDTLVFNDGENIGGSVYFGRRRLPECLPIGHESIGHNVLGQLHIVNVAVGKERKPTFILHEKGIKL